MIRVKMHELNRSNVCMLYKFQVLEIVQIELKCQIFRRDDSEVRSTFDHIFQKSKKNS